ncbi:MAG: adenylyltransferase/cytidyltransferase family protein [Candidatus Colwellbacteria bacterium]|nr:adenylyltransferase/cytidyltransferase family protein [Candidatus Colwellbacteria bacterium]
MKKQRPKPYKRVIVFGVFDGFHEGHHSFLSQAISYGTKLIIVVARDQSVKDLKNKSPRQSETDRLKSVRAFSIFAKPVLGDLAPSSYKVIKMNKPDAICLGYDQNFLKIDLQRSMRQGTIPETPIIQLKAYRPRRLHTSLIPVNRKGK